MDMIDNGIVKNMAGMARQGVGTEAYDTIAEVVRTEGSTAWVHIPGGVDETPIAMSVSAKEGDTVRVRVAGGQAWIVGNDTAPPTDDSLAKKALEVAGKYPKIIKTGRIESEDGQSFWDLDEGILNMKGYVTSVKAEYALSMSPTTPPAGSATWTEEYITSIPAAAYLWRRLTVSITADEALTMVEMIASGSGDLGPITAARQDMQCTYTDSSGAEHEYTLKCLLLYPETMDSATAPEKINLTYGKVETTDGSMIAVPASCLMFTSYINHNITSLSVNFYIVYRAGTEQLYLVYYDGTDGIWKGAAITRGIAEDGTVEFPGGVEVQAPVGWKKRLYSSGPHFDLDAQFHCFMENNSGGGMIHYSNLIEQFVWQTNDAVIASVQFGTPTTVDTVSANQVHIVPVQSANYFNPARRISDLDEFNASYTQKKNIGAVNLLTGTRTAKTVTQGYLPYDEPAEPGLQGCTDIYPVQLTAGRSLPSVKNINTVTLSYEWSLATRGTAPKSFLVCLPYDSEGLGYYDDYILLDEVTIGSSTGGSRAVTVSVEGMEAAVGGNIAVLYDYGDLEEGQSITPSKVTVRHMQLEVGETPTDWAPNPDDYLNKSGDTMTGNLLIEKESGDTGYYAKRTDTGVQVWMGVGSGGNNHGVYSNKQNRWLLYGNATDVYLAGVNYSSQTANKVLASPNGSTGAPAFRALVAADLPTVTVAKGGTGAATAAANRVFAGPSSGDAAAPSFRALVAADIPGLAASKITSGTLAIARGGTGAATAAANRVFAGPSSGDAAAPSFRALAAADIPGLAASKITSGTLAIARGGTGKTYGYTWQSLGSCTGTGNKTYDLTNYSEVMVVAKFASKIMTTVIPKAALTTSNQELWVGGGKSANTSANGGAVRAVCEITTTKLTGVSSNNGATDTTSSTTWYIYAR